MYLVSALSSALTSYPTKTWLQCCEDASNTCKVFATPYKARSVMNWWHEFRKNDAFPHPRGLNGVFKRAKERLPPFLADNEDLLKKFVSYCTANLSDLSVDLAREYVIEQLSQWHIHLPLASAQSTGKRHYPVSMVYLTIHQSLPSGNG